VFDSRLGNIFFSSPPCQGRVLDRVLFLGGRSVTLTTYLHLVWKIKNNRSYTLSRRPKLIVGYSVSPFVFAFYTKGGFGSDLTIR
jgi:hypothetical protein